MKFVPDVVQNNEGLKKIGGLGALELVNLGVNKGIGLDPATHELVGEISGAVKSGLEMTGATNLMASNPLFNTIGAGATGLGAMALSNTVLKDLGLENKWLRYGLNLGAAGTAFAAGSAALPYIAGGSIAYWAGKHGWNYGGKALSMLGNGTKRSLKGVVSTATETVNSTVGLATVPFRALYNGLVGDTLLKLAPVKAMTNSVGK